MTTRIAEIEALAEKIWKDPLAAESFLDRPHVLLGHQTPRSVAERGQEGVERVRLILGQLYPDTGV